MARSVRNSRAFSPNQPMRRGAAFDVDVTSLTHFAKTIRDTTSRKVRDELRTVVKHAGRFVADEARLRYAEVSRTAAASVRVTASITRNDVSVTIHAGGEAAPLAQLLELGNLVGGKKLALGSARIKPTFRHPVYGRPGWARTKHEGYPSWTWTDKNSRTHPSLYPAARAQRGRVTYEVQEAIRKVWRSYEPMGGV